MIGLDAIKNFYPPHLRDNALFNKHLLKEYLQLLILDYLAATPYIRKITFTGGTSIRLIKGIDRFSEDLDFDCKDFSQEEFKEMTDGIIKFLQNNGLHAEGKENMNTRLKAFRRNILFPELLFSLELTGHREERFLIKIESQDQEVGYKLVIFHMKGCGFFFPMAVPPDEVLCAMKVSAMLNRRKVRDFYDAMFLLSQTLPDFNFLNKKSGISNLKALKEKVASVITSVDLTSKMKDFEHLLFNRSNSRRILQAGDFFKNL